MSLPLDAALRQCARHAEVMSSAIQHMPLLLTSELLAHPTPELTRLLDQFVLRFTKLQDTLGTHVLRQFAVQILAEPVEDLAFIEVLNLLERRGYLTADGWADQRSIRNAMTHEDPEDPQRQVLSLTAASMAAARWVMWLEKIQARCKT